MTASASTAQPAPNVDPQELDKFQSIASRWWDPNSEFAPLHAINPLRVEWVRQHLPAGFAGQRVLDVGCGGGLLTEAMAREGAQALGIDLADKSLTVARLHALESGIPVQYRRIAVEALAQEAPESFDIVTCMEMLEHVPHPEAVVEACAQLVRPGGQVFFSTLSRTPRAFLHAILGAEYILKMLPRGTHDYSRFIRPSELAAGARAAGLEVTDITGLTYQPLTRQYRLVPQDGRVNYLMALVRPLP